MALLTYEKRCKLRNPAMENNNGEKEKLTRVKKNHDNVESC